MQSGGATGGDFRLRLLFVVGSRCVVLFNNDANYQISEPSHIGAVHLQDMTGSDGGADHKEGVTFAGAGSANTDRHDRSSAYKRITSMSKGKATLSSVFDFKEDDAPRWRQRVLTFLDSAGYVGFSVVLIILALFADDIRLAVCPPSADIFFEALTYFLLAAFALEMGE